ncbi:hypothetical protein VNO78_17024 [Psophocarpus tetragonolobus]|uniref:Uncharacterized protein n=1 Tax=Psophocarpus tetragonolobus TaxID=3891 RepID=A0AAN9XL37_PSOTE
MHTKTLNTLHQGLSSSTTKDFDSFLVSSNPISFMAWLKHQLSMTKGFMFATMLAGNGNNRIFDVEFLNILHVLRQIHLLDEDIILSLFDKGGRLYAPALKAIDESLPLWASVK